MQIRTYKLLSHISSPAVFEPFFKHYIQTNAFKSIDTDVFKNMFINYFTNLGMSDAIASIDWDAWLYTPGMPVMKPK
jgi:leukotriene-A4 hydrolase